MKLVNVIEHVGDGYFQLQGFDRLTFCYNLVKGQKVLLPEFFQVTNKETGEGVLHKLRERDNFYQTVQQAMFHYFDSVDKE